MAMRRPTTWPSMPVEILTSASTALLLARELSGKGLKVSRIASGVPHGGDLEFADQITLGRAIDGRRAMRS